LHGSKGRKAILKRITTDKYYTPIYLNGCKFTHAMQYVSLISDFGPASANVSMLKGMLVTTAPQLRAIDYFHELQPFNLLEAAYMARKAMVSLPVGSVHVVMVDALALPAPRILACRHQGHYFVAPDNGIIIMALEQQKVLGYSTTLHGTDTTFIEWAKKAASLVGIIANSSAPIVDEISLTAPANSTLTGIPFQCTILHIDSFGNVVTNFTRKQFEQNTAKGEFKLNFTSTQSISKISTHYNDVPEGKKLCRFNKVGYLEIAINNGNAAQLLGLAHRSKYNQIFITFR
jgi:S-adenosyl-L-methionine hydrolase (adenosine-forming)